MNEYEQCAAQGSSPALLFTSLLSPSLLEETDLPEDSLRLWWDGRRDPACPHLPERESEASGGLRAPTSWKQASWKGSNAPSCGLE